MSPKKGDLVSVPPLDGWNVVFGTTDAVAGWEDLCRAALPNAHRCLDALRTDPLSRDNWNRQHQLRGRHATKAAQRASNPRAHGADGCRRFP